CATVDETFHLTGGMSYWALGDFRLQPENGNLAQRWAALPLWLSGFRFPSLDQPSWKVSDMFNMVEEFIYTAGNDACQMLDLGRSMIVVVSVAVGMLVFGATRRLYGTAAAMVAVTLFALCPTTLAHGALTTSDMAVSLCFLAAVGAIWKVLHRVTWLT